jgi:predicted transcriptional regulator
MGMDNFYEKLNKLYESSTNLLIIYLLLENESMTVTEMSKNLNMTRSNLYRSVKNLVKENVIHEKSSLIEKNYVKKYYELNLEFFKGIDTTEQLNSIKKLDPVRISNILSSFFKAQAAYLNLQAQKLDKLSLDEMKNLQNNIMDNGNNFLLSFSSLSNESYLKVIEKLKKILNEMEKEDKTTDSKNLKIGDNTVLLLAMPVIRIKTHEL